jgi:hypothetical protein
VRQNAARQVGPKLALDEARHPRFLGGATRQEGLEVGPHDLVEHRLLGGVPPIRPGRERRSGGARPTFIDAPRRGHTARSSQAICQRRRGTISWGCRTVPSGSVRSPDGLSGRPGSPDTLGGAG